ncbi:extracellular solute-binding protein [Acuticoccus mangrovi]|uniref:Extracellular solute-binding protein n=1 Tax=Acuticoccus mangrovi TaxID=2796142 RepID=A0A934MLX0_9HYPH|nr:extracellular solute-binding protein [Acuticoccus mangrovi]MBJ3776744.1 extracellular solute-binding protein [Acuticoccus mangrovi]
MKTVISSPLRDVRASASALAVGAALYGAAVTPAAAWSYKEAAEPYKGTTISILDEVTPLQEIFATIIPQFTEETGIKVNYQLLNHFEVINRGQADMLSGRGEYDAVMAHGVQYGLLLDAGVIEPIDDMMADAALMNPDLDLDDLISPAFESLSKFDGKLYGFLLWNYNMVYWARQDLLGNDAEKAAFEEKYGYPLAPATTLSELYDISEFFTRSAGETLAGETLADDFYGIVLEGINGGTTYAPLWYVFIRNLGGNIFDEAGVPTFDTPEVIEGLKQWSALWKFAPPGQAEYSLIDVPTVMGNGIAAQTIAWSDFVLGIDQPGASALSGSFLYAAPPGTGDGTYSSAGEPSAYVISSASKNPEATFLFFQWAIDKMTQKTFLSGGIGVPIRDSSWDQLITPDNRLAPLYEAMKGSLEGVTAAPKAPRMLEILDVFNRNAQQVGLGQMTPEEGAKAMQAGVSAICNPCFLQ